MYSIVLNKLDEFFGDEKNFIANAANLSALLYSYMEDINWVGFYMLNDQELVLGPFQGKVACIRIDVGKGVCGTAAKKRETVIVDDVHSFPGHIACDLASNSELVVPLIRDGELFGVLDIDSPEFKRFTDEDKTNIEKIVETLLKCSDMESLRCFYNPNNVNAGLQA